MGCVSVRLRGKVAFPRVGGPILHCGRGCNATRRTVHPSKEGDGYGGSATVLYRLGLFCVTRSIVSAPQSPSVDHFFVTEATWQHSSFRNSRPASMSTLHFVRGKPNGAATIWQGANIHRTHQQSSILVLSHGMKRRFVLKGPFSLPCYHSHNDAILALEVRKDPNTHTPMLSATPCVEMIRAL